MGIVYGHGINDMSRGWASENEWNKKLYQKWKDMLARCYSEKVHGRQPTYIGCSVCDDWIKLSNFVRDFKLIDGYDEELFLAGKLELDKDIKSNGQNKEYSLENCLLVNHSENTKQSNKTMDYSFISVKIAQYDKQGNLIKVWHGSREIQRETGINQSNIIKCCRGKQKTAGDYIFKYAEED